MLVNFRTFFFGFIRKKDEDHLTQLWRLFRLGMMRSSADGRGGLGTFAVEHSTRTARPGPLAARGAAPCRHPPLGGGVDGVVPPRLGRCNRGPHLLPAVPSAVALGRGYEIFGSFGPERT